MAEFKVGDRVVVKSDYCGAAVKGLFGTIVTVETITSSCGVELDVDFYSVGDPTRQCGHNCGGKAKRNRGWYIDKSELSLIDEPTPAPTPTPATEPYEFKIGDRVVAIENHDRAAIMGLCGTVRTLDCDEKDVGVEFDVAFYHIDNPTLQKGHSCNCGIKGNRGWFVPKTKLKLISAQLEDFLEEKKEKKEKRKPITIPKSKLSAIDIIKCHIASVTHPYASIDESGMLIFYKETPTAISYFETATVVMED